MKGLALAGKAANETIRHAQHVHVTQIP